MGAGLRGGDQRRQLGGKTRLRSEVRQELAIGGKIEGLKGGRGRCPPEWRVHQ